MSIRPLLRYPDPALSLACLPVEHFDEPLRTLSADLLQTMRAAPGVGITAAHVGVLLRVVVLELDPKLGPRTFVNPEIGWFSEETEKHTEGSVCMPGATEEIVRPAAIRFTYRDLDGTRHEEEMRGFPAICMQHEIDQLDGIFWIDRLSRLKRERIVRKFRKAGE